MKRSS
jgi:hypothetical protein